MALVFYINNLCYYFVIVFVRIIWIIIKFYICSFIFFMFTGGDEQNETGEQGDKGREGHTEGVQPVVEIGHGKHRQHHEAFDEQQLAFDAED